MKWSKEKKPNSECPYNHVDTITPIGKLLIDWKGWKELPSYDISLDGDYVGSEYSLEDAKERAMEYLEAKSKELTNFLTQKGGQE